MYIAENWTDEMLQVMLEKLVERKQRLNRYLSGQAQVSGGDRVVSDETLFKQLGKKLRVIK